MLQLILGIIIITAIWVGIYFVVVLFIYGISLLIGLMAHRKLLTFTQSMIAAIILIVWLSVRNKNKGFQEFNNKITKINKYR